MVDTCKPNCDKELNIVFRATTPVFTFNVCLDTTILDLQNTHIVFASGSSTVDKTGNDIVIVNGTTLTCALTQNDTLSFNGDQVNIQILATLINGQKTASFVLAVPVNSTLKGNKSW